MNELMEKLKKIGFTEYEAKIYIALLGRKAINGNEVANLSGVPGAKVYRSLQSMVEKGYVSVMYDETTAKSKMKYKAIPYEQILQAHLSIVTQDVEYLKENLKVIEQQRPSTILKQELYQIIDYDLTFKTIIELIQNCYSTIYLSCWREQQAILRPYLEAAFNRGVKIVVLLYDDAQNIAPWTQFHHISAKIVEERHKDEINIVVDQKSVVISKIQSGNVFTVVSDNAALIQTTLNYIRHDIYVNRVLQDFYQEGIKKYGPELQDLLNI